MTDSPAIFDHGPTPMSPPTPTRIPAWPFTIPSIRHATPWVQIGGTSLSASCGRAWPRSSIRAASLAGGEPLGSDAMLADLYNLDNIAPGDFHDITAGNNGYPAGPGYDLVTGLGSPRANLLIPDLAAYGLASQATIVTEPPPSVVPDDHVRHRRPGHRFHRRSPTRLHRHATLTPKADRPAPFTPVTVPVTARARRSSTACR